MHAEGSPLPTDLAQDGREGEPDLDVVARKLRAAFEALGLDFSDPNLAGTEWRVARSMRDLFASLYLRSAPDLRTFANTEGYSEMVAVTDISFQSLCAHHLLPFVGVAHVAYLPGDRIVGLAKLARLVDFYGRQPQIQERMTEQVVQTLEDGLRPRGAMVVLQARHLCMEMRGVAKPGAMTTTSAIRGAFEEGGARQEFLNLLGSWRARGDVEHRRRAAAPAWERGITGSRIRWKESLCQPTASSTTSR